MWSCCAYAAFTSEPSMSRQGSVITMAWGALGRASDAASVIAF